MSADATAALPPMSLPFSIHNWTLKATSMVCVLLRAPTRKDAGTLKIISMCACSLAARTKSKMLITAGNGRMARHSFGSGCLDSLPKAVPDILSVLRAANSPVHSERAKRTGRGQTWKISFNAARDLPDASSF